MNNNYPMAHYGDGTVIAWEGYNYIRFNENWRCLGPCFELFTERLKVPQSLKKNTSKEINTAIESTTWTGHIVRYCRMTRK